MCVCDGAQAPERQGALGVDAIEDGMEAVDESDPCGGNLWFRGCPVWPPNDHLSFGVSWSRLRLPAADRHVEGKLHVDKVPSSSHAPPGAHCTGCVSLRYRVTLEFEDAAREASVPEEARPL